MASLYFTDAGKGDVALVFLHYYAGSGRAWQPVIEHLQSNYRCIAIDLPGFGQSDIPRAKISVNDSRDAVLQIMEVLQLNRFILIGHSMGGKIALAAGAVQPLGLSNIILFAPSPPTPEPMTTEEQQTLQEAFGSEEKIRRHLQSIIAGPIDPELFDITVADNLLASKVAWDSWLQLGTKEDISVDMKRIQVPLTIASGSEDKSLNIAFLKKEFGRYFSNTSFIEIQKSGHLLPLEKTNEVIAIIQSVASLY